MCMEDIRIGRKTNGTSRLISMVNGPSVQICGPNENRIALVIWNINCNGIYIDLNPVANNLEGAVIGAGAQNRVEMRLDVWGDMITKPWQAKSDTSGNIMVFELFLNDR